MQNNIPPQLIPIGMALTMFTQTFGGAICVTLGQTIFGHSLAAALREYAPHVDPKTVVQAGATAVRQAVPPSQLEDVLRAYCAAINHNFYLAAATGVAMVVFAFGMGWKRIPTKADKKAKAASAAA